MKKLYTLLFSIAAIAGHSQYLDKDWEDLSLLSGGWTQQIEVDTTQWRLGTVAGNYARISNWDGMNVPAEAWLISPVMDLVTAGATNPELTFDNTYRFAGPVLELYVSTDYDGTSLPSVSGTWTNLSSLVNWDTDGTGWTFVGSGAIDLTAYISATTYLAWRYTGSASDGSTWEIDNVLVDEAAGPAPTTTIYDIQYTTASPADSPYNGMTVTTGGIVTAAAASGYWIQEATGMWRGVYVFDGFNTPAEGDSVIIEADVDEFNGVTELTNVTTFNVISSGNALPTASDIITDTTNIEPYEGVLVRAGFANCTNPSAGFGQWIINDGSGELFIDDMMFGYTASMGTQYRVTGPLHYSFNEWKVEPRDIADIEVGTGIGAIDPSAISIYPNPAMDQVMIDVTEELIGSHIRIVSVDGREVINTPLNSTMTSIDVSRLDAGVYSVLIGQDILLVTNTLVVR